MTLADKKELLTGAIKLVCTGDKYPALSPLVYGRGIPFTVDFNGDTGLIHLLSQKEVNFECDFAFHVKRCSNNNEDNNNEELCVAFREVPVSEGGTGHEFYVYTARTPGDEKLEYQFTCKAPMGDIIDDKLVSLTGLDRVFARVAVHYAFIAADNGSF